VLARKPGFTAAAVLMLGLGIGANAAIFSLVNAFLWKPQKIHQAEELVGLCHQRIDARGAARRHAAGGQRNCAQ